MGIISNLFGSSGGKVISPPTVPAGPSWLTTGWALLIGSVAAILLSGTFLAPAIVAILVAMLVYQFFGIVGSSTAAKST